jgi:hypothetical protein
MAVENNLVVEAVAIESAGLKDNKVSFVDKSTAKIEIFAPENDLLVTKRFSNESYDCAFNNKLLKKKQRKLYLCMVLISAKMAIRICRNQLFLKDFSTPKHDKLTRKSDQGFANH